MVLDIVRASRDALEPLGWKRRGQSMLKSMNGNDFIVGFQKSWGIHWYWMNLGIILGGLPTDNTTRYPNEMHAHIDFRPMGFSERCG